MINNHNQYKMGGIAIAFIVVSLLIIITLVISLAILGYTPSVPSPSPTPEPSTGPIYVITNALWWQQSNPANILDVTAATQRLLNSTTGVINCPGGFYNYVTDIAKGYPKSLRIDYTKNGVRDTYSWDEHISGASQMDFIQLR